MKVVARKAEKKSPKSLGAKDIYIYVCVCVCVRACFPSPTSSLIDTAIAMLSISNSND